ncbi:MAG: hypothetical protein A3A51_03560 [Candidatus Levybacteria bacterium RIFCSPLOWO2_01_FULL_39_10]|nr:MAG: hypothetical protein A3A51_03560 [Candidatus Levybacteria bacterium RIFCSPLOWO2_01_FULL_39_10]
MVKRRFPKPRKKEINQEEIKLFFKTIDFEPNKIFQEWRHLLAFGKYQGKASVFKLASTQKTSKYTQNEYKWNDAVCSVPEYEHPNFIVPANYSKGNYGKLFYFIEQFFEGGSLINRNSNDLSKISPKIEQIAKAVSEIIKLPIHKNSEFAKSKSNNKKSIGERLLNSTLEWASQVPINLDNFLNIIDKNKNNLRTGIAHGDFVPRQLFDVNGKIGVIDGEHAGYKGPLYYDAAWFYLRLRIDHNGRDLAKQFLIDFKNLLSREDQETFWEELKPVLIQRYIGELWGSKNNPKVLGERSIIGKAILGDKIVS